MLNKVVLIGNVGADPDIRAFDNGNMVAKFRIGTSETWKDKNGEKKSQTEWHTIEAWGKPAAIVDEYVRKGDKLYIEGQLHYEEYERDGQTRKQTVIRLRELKLLSPKREETQNDDFGQI